MNIGKTLVFFTKSFTVTAATICGLYKARWQVELVFKWIKQHLRIKKFYGNSEYAVVIPPFLAAVRSRVG